MSRSTRLAAAIAVLALAWSGVAYAQDNPTARIDTPTTGASAEVGEPVLVTGSAVNGEAGGVTSVELTFDNGASWLHVGDGEVWQYLYTPAVAGDVTIASRASTASAVGARSNQVTVHVGGEGAPAPVTCECPFWLPERPFIQDPDTEAVELGLRTRIDRDGWISGVFLRRGSFTGPVTVRVWSGDGLLLAEQTSAPAAIFQRIMFATPVPVQQGKEYVVSYYTAFGGYAASEHYFEGALVKAPFSSPRSAGVYRYGGGFPTETWRDSNYWIMPLFQL